MFSTEELLFKGANPDVEDFTILVDVAGRPRYDTQAFKDRFRTSPDYRIFLLSLMVSKSFTDIVRMENDFFTEQPTKGRR